MKSKTDYPSKYRPTRISEIYGQAEIKKVVARGLDNGSLPNSLLFYGPSGTGKTTIARIIAMGSNCEKGHSSEPCCECRACREVIHESPFIYHEINCANVTGIDHMRKFRGHFYSYPLGGDCNIFVFDECHKLSPETQTLLLKDVEDCVPSTYFIFCSTEPEKIIETLRNRCMAFEFKKIAPEEMRQLLHDVCQKERVIHRSEVLERIIDESDGMARNALFLLQQAVMLLT
jgi:DNA polymerase-3 subunit gamma/tau